MIFSDSPVKNITEKLNPLSQRNKISKLKFERKKDYKTFLDFIKKNTKELEQRDNIVEKTKKVGLVAGGLGIAALLFGSVRGKKESDNLDDLRKNLIPKAIRRAERERERDERRGTESSITGFQKAPSIGSLLSKLFQKKPGALVKASTSNVKSKERVKQNAINREMVNQNRKKRLTSKQKLLTAAGGIDSRNQKLLPDQAKSLKDKKIKSIIGKASQSEGGKLSKSDLAKMLGVDPSKLDKNTSDINAEIELSKIKKDGFFKKTRQNLSRNRQLNLPLSNVTDNIGDLIGTDIESPTPSNVKRQITDQVLKETYLGRKRDARNVFGSLGLDTPEAVKNKIKVNDFIDDLEARSLAEDIEYEETKKERLKNIKKIRSEKMFNKNLNKITNFSNRILNSPVAKFSTFMGGLLANPKVEIIKQLLTPTPLADGTLEGKPGVDVNFEKFVGSEGAVNIFLNNNNQSMIPFNPDLKFNNDVIPPTDFPTPSSNIFIDPKQQLNIDDIFFLRSFSGG